MALTPSEILRIRLELGYNGLTLSALPYAFDGITAIFDQVLTPYLQSGLLTTSSTAVVAVGVGNPPADATLTLASVVGLSVMDRMVIDVDTAQETAHISNIVGSTITLALQNAHTPPYAVNQEGAEAVVRDRLNQCIAISARIGRASSRAGVKKADEVEFFAGTGSQRGVIGDLLYLQQHWRTELATACGCGPNINANAGGGGSSLINV
jgi:hypothetical protein